MKLKLIFTLFLVRLLFTTLNKELDEGMYIMKSFVKISVLCLLLSLFAGCSRIVEQEDQQTLVITDKDLQMAEESPLDCAGKIVVRHNMIARQKTFVFVCHLH